MRSTSPLLACPYLLLSFPFRSNLDDIQCVARKIPELCKAYTPGKTDQDATVRLARLEHVVRIALPQFAHHLLDSSSISGDGHMRTVSPGLDDDAHSQNEEQDPHGGTFQSGKWYGNSASGSVTTASVLEQVRPRSAAK